MSPLRYWETLVIDDDSLPLFEAALSIAQDVYTDLDMAGVVAEVDSLTAQLKTRFPADAPVLHKLRMLNHFFFNELHFQGNVNDYYAADNSYLHKVLERRSGIPISLAVVYIEIGQQAGIPLQGVSFPGSFLVRLKVNEGWVFIDVFEGGRSLSRSTLEERLEPFLQDESIPVADALPMFLTVATPRDVLARMLRNLKNIYSNEGDHRHLLQVIERLVILLPDDASEVRDRGLCHAAMGHVRDAAKDLQAYLKADPAAEDHEDIVARLETLKLH